jgi:hypothetical protein
MKQSSSDADAAHDMAVKAAEGIDGAQNWAVALDQLQRAAELGSLLAQAELAGLAGDWPLAHTTLSGMPMPQLRGAIDLDKWLTPAYSVKPMSDGLRMAVIRDLAEPEICDWLIERARPRLERAKVYAGEINPQVATARTNRDCIFTLPDRDIFMAILRTRIVEATQRQMREMEPPMVLNYSVGQEFHAHYDSPADPNTPGFRQRLITVLLSLNDQYEGGATAFPIVGGRWRGRKGTAIYFWNVTPDGTRDERSLHAGLPITRGEKWMMTQFITRSRPTPR